MWRLKSEQNGNTYPISETHPRCTRTCCGTGAGSHFRCRPRARSAPRWPGSTSRPVGCTGPTMPGGTGPTASASSARPPAGQRATGRCRWASASRWSRRSRIRHSSAQAPLRRAGPRTFLFGSAQTRLPLDVGQTFLPGAGRRSNLTVRKATAWRKAIPSAWTARLIVPPSPFPDRWSQDPSLR